ncbi:SH2 domain-containing protein 1B [Oryzias melastigma]|uniref:SH2 domain-containing protein 1B n=1 Tax=Oryzias melastigma TaxID=30732 RepID=UPI000CF7EBDE|nr:SH2 domain-containing protein 1B [Oryzias melastigma]
MASALPECYHGPISKAECEELLAKKKKDGAYLIRDSETIQGAMCLCVLKWKVVHTYRLFRTHSGNYTLMTATGVNESTFKTLDDLIRNYKRRNQGLVMHLRHAVKRKMDLMIQSRPPHVPERPTGVSNPPAAQSPQRNLVPVPDNDYENVVESDYVEVLPD